MRCLKDCGPNKVGLVKQEHPLPRKCHFGKVCKADRIANAQVGSLVNVDEATMRPCDSIRQKADLIAPALEQVVAQMVTFSYS